MLAVSPKPVRIATMKCPKCKRDGADPGRVLPGELRRTLRFVKLNPATSAPYLAREFTGEAGYTAVNNRLERLRKLGLVLRERDGRAWRYYVV